MQAIEEKLRQIASQLEQSQTTVTKGFFQVSQSMVDQMLTSLGFEQVSGWATDDYTEELAGI